MQGFCLVLQIDSSFVYYKDRLKKPEAGKQTPAESTLAALASEQTKWRPSLIAPTDDSARVIVAGACFYCSGSESKHLPQLPSLGTYLLSNTNGKDDQLGGLHADCPGIEPRLPIHGHESSVEFVGSGGKVARASHAGFASLFPVYSLFICANSDCIEWWCKETETCI